MKLRQIIAKLGKVEVVGSLDKEVTGVAYDSRCVTPGKLFVAIRGVETDGHRFIGTVAEKGAVAVVCEQKGASGGKMTRIIVPDSRKALPLIAAAFYKNPADHLWMIGVTGTNGKTTV
ncbi:MAG: UDP-N-acetylmuramoyl-L-alanyl-D-glutamate--2,6-diaminopimelate ligase, partial [Verrucomicrobia bacterium]|nr:UDP-N-acetylmuramoyl-L-alanyl-D-glutamate--2,6-diaminopimelate ligase [Verrucomicrobiota bacterium]